MGNLAHARLSIQKPVKIIEIINTSKNIPRIVLLPEVQIITGSGTKP
ncbi:hypothetical protein CWATWH0402_1048 [Crocosphaera watsonii WH 0402]|uniref:Uncharacterized protein n=2 Tax=Crocosphaera watsonii TaxID=263511 RepID=T2JVV5_CROWT|nr:hypothetical protein CWATWH0005_3207 [Crocosphaera watsonii WH 0005]CCQ69923.1 hypothetical protein CWATWH0402_1048 [Crocosphaera watsonii WH 0402]